LATGDNLRTIALNFSVGVSTVWDILDEGVQIIWKALKREYVKVSFLKCIVIYL